MMSSIIALALQVAAVATLSVRVVDVGWRPVAGIEVGLIQVSDCANQVPTGGTVIVVSNAQGEATAPVSPGESYVLRSGGDSGWERREQCMALGELAGGDMVFALLRLRIDPRGMRTFYEPAADQPALSPDGFPLTEISGVYLTEDGEAFVVDVIAEPKVAVLLVLPDLREAIFERTSGLEFRGSDGVVSFHVRDGAIESLSVSWHVVTARKQ
jgi:hypothetical protein